MSAAEISKGEIENFIIANHIKRENETYYPPWDDVQVIGCNSGRRE